MYYSTVYVGMDVHKENFSLCCYTNEREEAEYRRRLRRITARFSTIWRSCVSITGTMCFLYAVMRQDASGLHCIMN